MLTETSNSGRIHCPSTAKLLGCYYATDTVFAIHNLRDVSTEDVDGFYNCCGLDVDEHGLP